MKFLSLALFALVAGFAEAKKVLDKQKLLRAAIPVDRNGQRRLADYEITYEYSIQFNQCLSLSTEPADETIFGDSYIAYTKAGQIIPQTSYVLFNVCLTGSCTYGADDNLWMVSLGSYLESMLDYLPEVENRYCEVCQAAEASCV
jgi:hypothetical protein